ncbi:MAG: gephyrin-like molybdotransferase Glp [Halioglobus sp.]
MSSLLSVAEALKIILASAPSAPRNSSPRSLLDALGGVLAEDVVSTIDVPLNDNSAMDGYAVRAEDVSGSPLRVSQRIPAGAVGDALEPGTAARIFTGAELPPGADAVVMQENCELSDDAVLIKTAVSKTQNVRPRGQDVHSGDVVLGCGRVLTPQDIGLIASVGVDSVRVFDPLRVAIMSTGDELIEPGQGELKPGQLFNSNRFTLAALLKQMNIEVIDGGIIPDSPQLTGEALEQAASSADCVLTSGGVSVGEEDHVKSQVERLGQLALWKLAIKPGKPLAFGRLGDTPFFGLPGNPTSVFVTFCILVRPYLLKLQGAGDTDLPRFKVRAAFTRSKPGTRQEYLRVMLNNEGEDVLATAYSNQSSGVLSSVSRANALAVIPAGATVQPGDPVEVIPLEFLGA